MNKIYTDENSSLLISGKLFSPTGQLWHFCPELKVGIETLEAEIIMEAKSIVTALPVHHHCSVAGCVYVEESKQMVHSNVQTFLLNAYILGNEAISAYLQENPTISAAYTEYFDSLKSTYMTDLDWKELWEKQVAAAIQKQNQLPQKKHTKSSGPQSINPGVTVCSDNDIEYDTDSESVLPESVFETETETEVEDSYISQSDSDDNWNDSDSDF